jgi:hypothetical protein
MIRPRKTLRRGEPSKAEKQELRTLVYARAQGMCQLQLVQECLGYAPLNGDGVHQGHLVHIKAKRVHGWGMDNLLWGCWVCHAFQHAGGKPCPPKH